MQVFRRMWPKQLFCLDLKGYQSIWYNALSFCETVLQAWTLHREGKVMDLVDPTLILQDDEKIEAQRLINIALLRSQRSGRAATHHGQGSCHVATRLRFGGGYDDVEKERAAGSLSAVAFIRRGAHHVERRRSRHVIVISSFVHAGFFRYRGRDAWAYWNERQMIDIVLMTLLNLVRKQWLWLPRGITELN